MQLAPCALYGVNLIHVFPIGAPRLWKLGHRVVGILGQRRTMTAAQNEFSAMCCVSNGDSLMAHGSTGNFRMSNKDRIVFRMPLEFCVLLAGRSGKSSVARLPGKSFHGGGRVGSQGPGVPTLGPSPLTMWPGAGRRHGPRW